MFKDIKPHFYNALFLFYIKMGVFYNLEAEKNLETSERYRIKAKKMYKKLKTYISNQDEEL